MHLLHSYVNYHLEGKTKHFSFFFFNLQIPGHLFNGLDFIFRTEKSSAPSEHASKFLSVPLRAVTMEGLGNENWGKLLLREA